MRYLNRRKAILNKMAWQQGFTQQQQPDPFAYGGGGQYPILIAVPHQNRTTFNFVKGLRSLQLPFNYVDYYSSGHPLDLTRNICVSKMLQLGCDYLFFVDSDILLQPDTFIQLWQMRMPIVSGVYMGRSAPYEPVANIQGKSIGHNIIKEPPQLREVLEVGMGCCLIERRVFERIGDKLNQYRCLMDHTQDAGAKSIVYTAKEARFQQYLCRFCKQPIIAEFFKNTIGTNDPNPMSEDYYFCNLARQNGYQIFVHNAVVVGHEFDSGNFYVDGEGLKSNLGNATKID